MPTTIKNNESKKMPYLWTNTHNVAPIASFVSDLHLSHTPPAFRKESREQWYEAMKSRLEQLITFNEMYEIPKCFLVGDIFDTFDQTAELVNMTIDIFKQPRKTTYYAIPGQHDLPQHVNENLHKSSLYTLIKSTAIHSALGLLEFNKSCHTCGFDFGDKATDPDDIPFSSNPSATNRIALIHGYCWDDNHGKHPQAKPEDHFYQWARRLKRQGFTGAVFGDNHSGFTKYPDKLDGNFDFIHNCGNFMIRKSDEVSNRQTIAILGENRKLYIQPFPENKPMLNDKAENPDSNKYKDVIENLRNITTSQLDFIDALEKTLHGVHNEAVKSYVQDQLQKLEQSS